MPKNRKKTGEREWQVVAGGVIGWNELDT